MELWTAFSEANVPIVMCASDYYAPYASVVIQSILDHKSVTHNYDLFILTKDMSSVHRNTLLHMVDHVENVSLRFLDMQELLREFQAHTPAHFTIESYFRSFIPYVLPCFEKVIYCDCDLIWMGDPAELFEIELGGKLMAAVIDPIYISNTVYDPRWMDYSRDVLHLSPDSHYVNTGVFLWNTQLFSQLFSLSYLLQRNIDTQFHFCDQDLLNALCDGAVQYLSPAWNVLADTSHKWEETLSILAERGLREPFEQANGAPKVLHWASGSKPWNCEVIDRGYLFWEIARRSPFYECILFRRAYELYHSRLAVLGHQSSLAEKV